MSCLFLEPHSSFWLNSFTLWCRVTPTYFSSRLTMPVEAKLHTSGKSKGTWSYLMNIPGHHGKVTKRWLPWFHFSASQRDSPEFTKLRDHHSYTGDSSFTSAKALRQHKSGATRLQDGREMVYCLHGLSHLPERIPQAGRRCNPHEQVAAAVSRDCNPHS